MLRLVRKEAEEALGPGRAAIRLQVPPIFRRSMVTWRGRATCANATFLASERGSTLTPQQREPKVPHKLLMSMASCSRSVRNRRAP